MDDPSLLADVNRWVGVSNALVGSVIPAPTGTRLLWHSATYRLRRRSRQMQGQLSRFVPFLRPPVTTHPDALVMIPVVPGSLTVSVSARGWPTNAPVDERIEALRQHIADVETTGQTNSLAQ